LHEDLPPLPPFSTRIIIRQFNGRAMLCLIEKIDRDSLKLVKVYLLEVVGSRGASSASFSVLLLPIRIIFDFYRDWA
jgi:hypothetical protein